MPDVGYTSVAVHFKVVPALGFHDLHFDVVIAAAHGVRIPTLTVIVAVVVVIGCSPRQRRLTAIIMTINPTRVAFLGFISSFV